MRARERVVKFQKIISLLTHLYDDAMEHGRESGYTESLRQALCIVDRT